MLEDRVLRVGASRVVFVEDLVDVVVMFAVLRFGLGFWVWRGCSMVPWFGVVLFHEGCMPGLICSCGLSAFMLGLFKVVDDGGCGFWCWVIGCGGRYVVIVVIVWVSWCVGGLACGSRFRAGCL
jgi:hypothetical protein